MPEAAIALASFAVEALLGWPARLHALAGHPVGGFARIITCCERRFNRQTLPPVVRRLGGILTVAILLGVAGGGAWLIEAAIRWLGSPAYRLLLVLAAWPAIAARSLDDHVRPVLHALEAGGLPEARQRVAAIVGRDTVLLDEAGVARAAIESLAESFCDGVIAPLFWLALLGLPGVWAYKAMNTADSLIGHPEAELRHFGWAAARGDDLLNLVPARLAGILLCLAGRGGWKVLWQDHSRHASPNAGWPEAAMAGALKLRLGGPVVYDGILVDKPWIGSGGEADAAALRRALAIYRRVCLVVGAILMGTIWLA